MIWKKIFRRPVDFFALLREQAGYITEAVQALAAFAKDLNEADAEKVKSLEKQADCKRFELIQELSKTFITPYDREDIFTLSKALDDILITLK